MKIKQYYVIAICLSLLFESDLLAQQHSTNTKLGTAPRLSGRAVRSSHTPGLSSRRRTKLNAQVINGVLKQNIPTKAGQRQIKAIEWRLRLRAAQEIRIENGKPVLYRSVGNIDGPWPYHITYWQLNHWRNWLPR